VKFSKLFEDEITLENLSRQQLHALCQVLNLTAIGSDYMLRFQLTTRLRQLLTDDKVLELFPFGHDISFRTFHPY